MTTPELLRYILDHVHAFGFLKWNIYATEIPKVPTPQEALAQAERRLEDQRAYVAAIENVEESITNPENLRIESLRLLLDYVDHPDKGGGNTGWIFSPAGTSYAHPPRADELERDVAKRIAAIRQWEAANKALCAFVHPSTSTP